VLVLECVRCRIVRHKFSAAGGEVEPSVNHTRAVTLVQVLKDGHLFVGSRRNESGISRPASFLGSSIFSILSKTLSRLCTWPLWPRAS
jgi:hypothetical protein